MHAVPLLDSELRSKFICAISNDAIHIATNALLVEADYTGCVAAKYGRERRTSGSRVRGRGSFSRDEIVAEHRGIEL